MSSAWSDVFSWIGFGDSQESVNIPFNGEVVPPTPGMQKAGVGGGDVGGHEDAWLSKVLGPAMQQIMGTALKPNTARAPLGGGHGVNASGGTAAKVPDTIMKMATLDEPLSNIQSFARLFG